MRKYLNSMAGNVTVLFAVSSLAIFGCVGAAVDYGRRLDIETQLQTAVDSAALAVASEGEPKRKAIAKRFFKENFAAKDGVSLDEISVVSSGGTVEVIAKAKVKTSFVALLGIPKVVVSARSVVQTSSKTLEIALVLDVSGSMNAPMGGSPRIAVLKDAANKLLDIVSKNGTDMTKVKISIVPFNMNVNVGTANTSFVADSSNPLFTGQSWAGCVLERAGAGATSDAYNGGTGPNGKWQAYVWPPEPNSNGKCTNVSNGSNSGYAALDAPSGYAVSLRGPNYNCVRHSVMPLSNSYATVKNKINQLTAEGNMGTIIGPGVSWGMRVLSPALPFDEGSAPSANVEKFMIVLTDGEQTTEAEYFSNKCGGSVNTSAAYSFKPSDLGLAGKTLTTGPKDMFSAYGYILDSDPFGTSPSNWNDVRTDLYNISMSACTKAKEASKKYPTRVFSIAVSNDAGPGTTTHKLLSNCATSTNDFYMASNGDALKKAFEDIANEIADVRLVQ